MKLEIEDLSPIKKRLSFEVPESDYQKALDKAYEKLSKTVQIKGFRQGKVPRSILEKYYGAKTAMDTVSEIVDRSYRDAVQKNEIPAVGLPKISDLKMDEKQPITFTAEVEVQPKVEAKHFEGIKLKKKKAVVPDEELNAELQALQKAHAQWIPIEEDVVAADGYLVQIDYEGTLEGKPFEGGSAQNVSLELGAGRFLKEFEENVRGVKKGGEKEFPLTFPKDYGAEHLRDKTATFKVKVQEIKKEQLPSLDDEFAKDLGNYQNLDQLKDEIRDRMIAGKESQEKGELFRQILDHLIKKNSFELPEAMIDRELDYMWNQVLSQLNQQKMTPEQVGINPQDYRTKNREEAVRRIKGFMLFDSIARQNKLEVEEAEVDAKLTQVAEQYKQPLATIKSFYQEKGLLGPLHNQILEEKTLEFIISKAKVSEKK